MAHTYLKSFVSIILALACTAAYAEGKKTSAELLEVPAGTLISIELVDPIHTGKNKAGDVFRGRVLEGVWSKNRIVVPPGTTVRGIVKEAERSGRIKKRAKLVLTLSSLQIDGSTIPLHTDTLSYLGDKHAGKNVGSFLGGAMQGAIMGFLFGGKKGAGVGAAAGAGVGAASGLIKGKQDIEFLQGARLLFETTEAVTVPVYPERPKPEKKPAEEKTKEPEKKTDKKEKVTVPSS